MAKEEPHVIQNALKQLKKSLSKKEPPKETQEVQADEEEGLSPDSIVEYRGMKMTVSQREEYIEMEEE